MMVLPPFDPAIFADNLLAYYAYAVVRPHANLSDEPLLIEGIEPAYQVQSFVQADLQVMVSAVPLTEYEVDRLRERVQDIEWLEARAVAHQRVLVQLMQYYTVVPLKFCTIYVGEERLRQAITEYGDTFRAALDRIEDCLEWGVKLFYDRSALTTWAQQEVPKLRDLANTFNAASEGVRYMLSKRLQRATHEVVDDLMYNDAQAIHQTLAALVRASDRHKPPATQSNTANEPMVLNGAYLVAEAEYAAFTAAVEQVCTTYGPRGLRLELTGPWPAYSFVEPTEDVQEVVDG